MDKVANRKKNKNKVKRADEINRLIRRRRRQMVIKKNKETTIFHLFLLLFYFQSKKTLKAQPLRRIKLLPYV